MIRLLLLSVKTTKRMAALTDQENMAKVSPPQRPLKLSVCRLTEGGGPGQKGGSVTVYV
jgi:hypothetical protein